MATLFEYLEKVYNEKMEGSLALGATSKEYTTGKGSAGVAETCELELVGKTIKGKINGQDVSLSMDQFVKDYPELAKKVLEILKRDGSVKYSPDKAPADFIKYPRTKNEVVGRPDIE